MYDLSSWTPENDFGILVQLIIGPEGGPGEESFDITLCTPGWLSERAQKEGVVDARHHVIVNTYHYDQVRGTYELASPNTRVPRGMSSLRDSGDGHWEFEDYRE